MKELNILNKVRSEEVRSRLGSGGSAIQSGEEVDIVDEEDR